MTQSCDLSTCPLSVTEHLAFGWLKRSIPAKNGHGRRDVGFSNKGPCCGRTSILSALLTAILVMASLAAMPASAVVTPAAILGSDLREVDLGTVAAGQPPPRS